MKVSASSSNAPTVLRLPRSSNVGTVAHCGERSPNFARYPFQANETSSKSDRGVTPPSFATFAGRIRRLISVTARNPWSRGTSSGLGARTSPHPGYALVSARPAERPSSGLPSIARAVLFFVALYFAVRWLGQLRAWFAQKRMKSMYGKDWQ